MEIDDPSTFGMTEKACVHWKTFPVRHLKEPFYIDGGQGTLKIISGGNVYQYRSSHTEPGAPSAD